MHRGRAVFIIGLGLSCSPALAGCPGGDLESYAEANAEYYCHRLQECSQPYQDFFLEFYNRSQERCRRENEDWLLEQPELGCTYDPDEGRSCLRVMRRNRNECTSDAEADISESCKDVFRCAFECSLYEQDCPPTDKCVPVRGDSGDWDSTKCVSASTLLPGEPCTVRGEGMGWYDSCGLDTMCWTGDPASTSGVCVAFCLGDNDDPNCDDGSACLITGEGLIPLCLPTCMPASPSCGPEETCVPASVAGTYVCAPAGI